LRGRGGGRRAGGAAAEETAVQDRVKSKRHGVVFLVVGTQLALLDSGTESSYSA
jgi:hypothetical protein